MALISKIKVLIVDDSAVIRQTVKLMLQDEPTIEVVGTAMNAKFAIHKISTLKPDVLILDIQMPEVDGLTFLQRLMKDHPMPVIIFSSYASEGSINALKALEYGAVEVLEKPLLASPEDIKAYKESLVKAIQSAASARVNRLFTKPQERIKISTPSFEKAEKPTHTPKIIAIGASTGGTEAIRTILEKLPPNTPPIVIVQHMPPVFTKSFAERLNTLSRLYVKEAETGDEIKTGTALIAPGDKHLKIALFNGKYVAQLDDSAPVNRHKPSVDVLFDSVAEVAGANSIGIILTGMGADGSRGLLKMKEKGAFTIAQDESTSVVFGMPKVAIKKRAVKLVLPVYDIPEYLIKILSLDKENSDT